MVSKNVSALEGLGLVLSPKSKVSVSENCWRVSSQVESQRSRSRLGLGPQGLIHGKLWQGLQNYYSLNMSAISRAKRSWLRILGCFGAKFLLNLVGQLAFLLNWAFFEWKIFDFTPNSSFKELSQLFTLNETENFCNMAPPKSPDIVDVKSTVMRTGVTWTVTMVISIVNNDTRQ
jgi:hypothetical protein